MSVYREERRILPFIQAWGISYLYTSLCGYVIYTSAMPWCISHNHKARCIKYTYTSIHSVYKTHTSMFGHRMLYRNKYTSMSLTILYMRSIQTSIKMENMSKAHQLNMAVYKRLPASLKMIRHAILYCTELLV